MSIRQSIMAERTEFIRQQGRTYRTPTMLFLSPATHTDLCAELTAASGQEVKTVQGAKLYGMVAHLVPTLSTGFHIA
jgi:hypothetical protein